MLGPERYSHAGKDSQLFTPMRSIERLPLGHVVDVLQNSIAESVAHGKGLVGEKFGQVAYQSWEDIEQDCRRLQGEMDAVVAFTSARGVRNYTYPVVYLADGSDFPPIALGTVGDSIYCHRIALEQGRTMPLSGVGLRELHNTRRHKANSTVQLEYVTFVPLPQLSLEGTGKVLYMPHPETLTAGSIGQTIKVDMREKRIRDAIRQTYKDLRKAS